MTDFQNCLFHFLREAEAMQPFLLIAVVSSLFYGRLFSFTGTVSFTY